MATRAEPSPDRIRLGVIGTGLAIKKLHWPALQRLSDRYEVVAFANDTASGAAWFAEATGLGMDRYYADYQELLRRDDVEAVLIALPIPLLYPAARAALQAGKHVVCEKPTGANLEEAQAFLALSDAFPHLKVLVAENYFYRDDIRLARVQLDAGAIGRVHLMAWRSVVQLVPREGLFSSTPWRITPAYRGGPQLDAGVHQIAQLRMLCGEIRSLHAYTRDANPTTGGPSDMVLNLHFASGAIGSFVAVHLPIPATEEGDELRLYGSEGILALSWRVLRLYRADGRAETYRIEADRGYYNELLNFYEAICFGEPIAGSIAQSYQNMLVVMRALDSAEQGRMLEVEPSPGVSGVPLWKPRGARDPFAGLPCRITSEAAGL